MCRLPRWGASWMYINCLIQDDLEHSQFRFSFDLRMQDENVKPEDYP